MNRRIVPSTLYLTGDFEDTWTAQGEAQPWPQSLLPSELPNARILTFGYDASVADWKGMVSQSRIANHSQNLLSALASCREDDKGALPIIFVCHSLGGLVCKDALVMAKQQPEQHLKSILDHTRGIVFLGTPHHGADLARWAEVLSRHIGLVLPTNTDIVKVLTDNSEVLARIQASFHTMIRARSEDNAERIKITCFYEEIPLHKLGLVVPQHSAILPDYIAIGIHANHMNMTKFSSAEDPGFVAVHSEIRRWVKEIPGHGESIAFRVGPSERIRSVLSEHIRKAGLDVEFVSNVPTLPESANDSLQNVDPVSMEWFTKSSEFQNWKQGGRGGSLLWLHGEPGDGRTAVASYVLSNLCHYFEYARTWDTAAVFCTKKHSAASLVASLVFQLVQNSLRAEIALKEVETWPTSPTEDGLTIKLWKILDVCIREVRDHETVLLIDGVDAMENAASSSFLMNLVALHKSSQVCASNRILISTRDFPHIRDVLSEFENIEKGKEMAECLRTLYFEEWNARGTRILSTDGGDWLSRNEEFTDWRNNVSSSILWIKGKPGSGKSTLAKRIALMMRQTSDDTVADFYYSFRGGVNETSHQLMLRSIVYQIWTQNERLWPFIRDKYRALKARSGTTASREQLWEYEDLKTALRCLQNADFALQVVIIVDGMDESESGRQNDVLRFLLELSQPTGPERRCAIKVLVASRPEVNITIHLHNYRQIVLQDVNRADIRKAINDGIGQLAYGSSAPPARFSSIKEYITDNSQGVFLWVSLVLQDLKRHVLRGTYSMAGLERRVRSLPKELGGPDGFYRSIVDSLIKRQTDDEPYEDQRDDPVGVARRILLWVTFSVEAMTIDDFEDILATPGRLGSTEESSYDFESHKPQDLERALFFYCGGLVEIRGNVVQLIHQTAREFLLDRKQPARPFNLEEAEGDREIVATSCRYLLLRFTTPIFRQDADASLEQLQHISQVFDEGRLLYYCFLNLEKHFNNLHNKREECLPELVALAEMLKSRPSSNASLLLSPWFKETSFGTTTLTDSNDADARNHAQSALVFTAGVGTTVAVIKLLLLGADPNGPSEDGMDALAEAVKRGHAERAENALLFGDDNADMRFHKDSTPMQAASAQGDPDVTRFLLQQGAHIDATSLQAATARGHYQVVKSPLDMGAEADIINKEGSTALQAASAGGRLDTIRLLLDRGADLSIMNKEGSTALQVASAGGHEKVVRLLLDGGANINAQDKEGSTALQAASAQGHLEVVELLLDGGADINAQDKEGSTALQAASAQGHLEVVELLLDKGVDVNARNKEGKTALQVALAEGYEEIAGALRERGAIEDV